MFLIPLISIISLVSIFYFLPIRILNVILILHIFFFTFQNIKIYPYNYIWLNNFSSFLSVNKNFDLDYWGASTKKIAQYLKFAVSKEKGCIISNRNDTLSYYTNVKNNCFISFSELEKTSQAFYVALLERKLNKGTPNGCKVIHEEKNSLNFSSETYSS